MSLRMEEVRRGLTASAGVALVAYTLYRLLAYTSYVSNFGFFANPLGYVSSGSFMLGAALGNLFSCAVVFLLYATGRLRPWSIPYRGSLLVVALVYGVIAFAPRAFLDEAVASSFLGVLWGLTITMIGFAALELLTAASSPFVLIGQLAVASLLFSLVSFGMEQLPGLAKDLLGATFALALWPLLPSARKLCRAEGEAGAEDPGAAVAASQGEPTPSASAPAAEGDTPAAVAERFRVFRATLEECSTPILATAFFELVVGLVNMYAASAHVSFTISTQAPLEGALICSVLVIAFVALTSAIPHRNFMYLGVFPGVIAVFLVLPYFGDVWGGPLSAIIYTAYSFTAMLSTFCIIRACRRTGDCVYGVAAVLSASMRLCLMVGLGLGRYFGGLTEGSTFVHLSIVGVTCVYVLGIVVVLWGLKNARAKRVVQVVEVVRVVEERTPMSFEESVAERVDELVTAYQLSPRERDVLVGLAQGNTAASIAAGLHLSTSTAQGYIKSLYAKLGVNKKQQVIDLFQK